MIYTKEIPESEVFDVVVCGGGPAGIGAAIAAAEHGAKTVIVERLGFFGGMATAGYVNPMSEFAYNGQRISGGIPWRFAQEMVALEGAMVEYPRCNISFDPEVYKLIAQRMLSASGVTMLMNTYMLDAITEEGRVTGIVVTNKSGTQLIRGKYFIDASGDADLAHFIGVPMLEKDQAMQPGTLCFHLTGVDTSTERMHIIHQKNHRFNHQAVFVRDTLFALREQGVHVPKFGGPWLATTMQPGCITVNMSRVAVNATDSEDLQQAEAQTREDVYCLVKLLQEHVEEFKNCKLASTATVLGIRESRRIRGVHVLTGTEYAESHRFDDSIARACHPVDIHLPGDEGQRLVFPKDAGYIPYRSLIAEGYPNFLAAGRCISADEEAFAAIRVQVPCMETGQAAGIAAALCLKEGCADVTKIDSAKVVELVRAAGSPL